MTRIGAAAATQLNSMAAAQSKRLAADEAQRRHNAALMAAYGDRMTLEDMEKAIEQYEKS